MTVVVGVGNEWRRDDAAGLLVARRLRGAGFQVLEQEGEPTALLDAWQGAEHAVVVDAVRSGAQAGTIHRIDGLAERLPVELFRGSTHAFSVAEAVELGRALDRLPRSLLIYGIEGGDFAAGKGLSPEVERAVDALVRELKKRPLPAPRRRARSAPGRASS